MVPRGGRRVRERGHGGAGGLSGGGRAGALGPPGQGGPGHPHRAALPPRGGAEGRAGNGAGHTHARAKIWGGPGALISGRSVLRSPADRGGLSPGRSTR